MKAGRWWRRGLRQQTPDDTIRVYWPQRRHRSSAAWCPDSWHRGPIPMSLLQPPPAEMSTTVNIHGSTDEVNDRRKARALQHRARQSKTKR